MKLLIDIGNSRLKWAVEEGGALVFRVACDYRQQDWLERLRENWRAIAPRRIAIANVGQKSLCEQVRQLCALLWPRLSPFVARSSALALGVSNAYSQPETLGVDRWLAMLAAHRQYSGRLCIVDCGTAITIDVLDHGRHLGGLISPGLATMRKSLLKETAALGEVTCSGELQFARHTEAAIAAGTMLAAVGLIESARQRLDDDYRLLLTGGDGELLAPQLAVPLSVDQDLVFKGLSALLDAEVDE